MAARRHKRSHSVLLIASWAAAACVCGTGHRQTHCAAVATRCQSCPSALPLQRHPRQQQQQQQQQQPRLVPPLQSQPRKIAAATTATRTTRTTTTAITTAAAALLAADDVAAIATEEAQSPSPDSAGIRCGKARSVQQEGHASPVPKLSNGYFTSGVRKHENSLLSAAEAGAANRAARLKALDALAAGGLRPGQELELISALDLGTVPWPEVPISLKQALKLPAGDKGIDSLALNLSIAVQAKDYAEGHKVPLAQLTNFFFLASAGPLGLHGPRLIVATNATSQLPLEWHNLAGAEHRRYSAEDVEAWRLQARDWAKQQPCTEVSSIQASTSPRWPHQEACLRACRKFLASGPQQRDFFVQIATGGGKSLIMADLLAELEEGGRACVIVPKLDLMEQVAQLLQSMDLPGISRVGTSHTPNMDARIFVCVRNSAWRLAHLDFDLLLLDKAHHYEPSCLEMEDIENDDKDVRTASAPGPRPQASTVLSLGARKRFFFSATLRWSRPDFDFGLRTAVRAGVISDYTILVPFMTAGDPKPSLVELIQDLPTARRILAFCNTVQEAKQFAKLLNAEGVQAGHYNGCTASLQRIRILEDFKKGPGRGGLRVLATVDVLSEGVDLPMADTCLFVEPRKGLRLRQCVGRVLRQHQQKVDALVVSPPIIQEADGGLIADGELVRLLSELAGADPELRKSLAENSFGRVSLVDQRSNRTDVSSRVALAVALEQAATLLSTKVYPRALSAYLTPDARWQLGLAQLTQYTQEHGHCKVQWKHITGSDFALGIWVSRQRFFRKANKLSAQQVKQLDALGFVWEVNKAEHLKAYKQEHGHTKVPCSYLAVDGFKLGRWVQYQRMARKGQAGFKIDAEKIEQLDSLGFVWGVSKAAFWEEGFQLLQAYKQEHGHTKVPQSYVADDGFKLGRWVQYQRMARKGQAGRKIDAEKIEQLDSLGFV
ncbi:unnamed protein product [Polarella glacialis]|uniref:Uncharacterized protein n=1 Tax=Polarella glacialis TaxID=89957 RepID=A0A813DHN3_POLGL|nr:unnamed protein product [Polarella glacialis]